MGAMFQFFRFFVLIAALLPLSCATRLQPPAGPSCLSESSSVIFGKLEVTMNGKLANPKPSIIPPLMQCTIKPYFSNDAIRTNPVAGGAYFFNVPINTNGYFSFVIPPGKYYFAGLTYLWLFSAYPNFSVNMRTWKKPYCLTFDVPANRAAYIGTVRSVFQVDADNPFYFKGDMAVAVVKDFAGAREWFSRSSPGFGTNVVEREVNITPL